MTTTAASLRTNAAECLRQNIEHVADANHMLATKLKNLLGAAIVRIEELEAEPATAPAPTADTIAPQDLLDELHARDMHTPTDAPVTAAAAKAALRTVLDGVEAVLGRVADAGGPVVVPVGLVSDADGWYPHDGTTWPACRPGDEVDYWLRGGDVHREIVGMLQWSHIGGLMDIIAWRPVRDGGPDKRDI